MVKWFVMVRIAVDSRIVAVHKDRRLTTEGGALQSPRVEPLFLDFP